MPQNKIFIGNLSFNLDKSDLTELFEQFGTITEVVIPTNRDNGRPRGFAFVTFETQEAAQNSLTFDNKEVDGRNIAVKIAQDKR